MHHKRVKFKVRDAMIGDKWESTDKQGALEPIADLRVPKKISVSLQ